jgi:hypothetical protein
MIRTNRRRLKIEKDCYRVNVLQLVMDGAQQHGVGNQILNFDTIEHDGKCWLVIAAHPGRGWELIAQPRRLKYCQEVWFLKDSCGCLHREFLIPRLPFKPRDPDMNRSWGSYCVVKASWTSELTAPKDRAEWRQLQRDRRGKKRNWVDGRGIAMKRKHHKRMTTVTG